MYKICILIWSGIIDEYSLKLLMKLSRNTGGILVMMMHDAYYSAFSAKITTCWVRKRGKYPLDHKDTVLDASLILTVKRFWNQRERTSVFIIHSISTSSYAKWPWFPSLRRWNVITVIWFMGNIFVDGASSLMKNLIDSRVVKLWYFDPFCGRPSYQNAYHDCIKILKWLKCP